MGSKSSKKKQKENAQKPSEKINSSDLVNFTNDMLITELKSDPFKDYTKIKFLGEGSFASVFKVQHKYTGNVRAMKVIKKTSSCTKQDDEDLLNEINILRRMDHPNIMKIFEFYSSPDSYSIVTELCNGGELFNDITDNGPFDEKYAAYVMYQIIQAVNYCHKSNIIHRDLKPENILIAKRDENNYPWCKICDFGTAKLFEKGKIEKKFVGSSYYIAPEVIKQTYNEKCDMWSCGVILYILLSARPPFGGDDDYQIMQRVSTGKYDLTSDPFNRVSKEALDLIKCLLEMNTTKRLSSEQALKHPWFERNKIRDLVNGIHDSDLVSQFIENLKTYSSDSIVQETALAYLVHNFSQREDVENASKLFKQIDIDNDGKITKQELLKGLKGKIAKKELEKDVEMIFKNLDADNNGYLQFNEFVRAAVNKESFLEENVLRFAFNYFDKDGNGDIDYSEIKQMFEENITDKTKIDEILGIIVKEVDTNGDGKISFEEFQNVMQKLLRKKKKASD